MRNAMRQAMRFAYARTDGRTYVEQFLPFRSIKRFVSRAGGQHKMDTEGNGLFRFGDVLADIGHEFQPHDCGRFEVRRTRFDEEREPIERGLRILVLKRDHFRCVWCGSENRLEMDHIVPWSAGGTDTFDNLRTLCHDCNTYRSNKGSFIDLACRSLQSALECVSCNPDCSGWPELRPVFCLICQRASSGVPKNPDNPKPGWEDADHRFSENLASGGEFNA